MLRSSHRQRSSNWPGQALSSLRIERGPPAVGTRCAGSFQRCSSVLATKRWSGIHGRGTTNSGPWSTRQALNGTLRGDRLCFPLQPNPRICAMTKSRSSVILRGCTLQAGAALHDAAVGEDGRRRYVARSVPGQERNHFRDLFGLGHSTQRNRSVELLHQRRVVHG